MKKTVKFHTLGCKTNQYESQAIREMLLSTGSFTEATLHKEADIHIINTCTVTAKADRDSRWIIRHCHREDPNAKIVVTGCLTEMDEDMIRALPGVSHIIRNVGKDKIRDILAKKKARSTNADPRFYTPLKIGDFEGRTRAFIKIQDGCDNRCSYCKIPLVRGNSRSRRLADILEEIERLLDKGFKELVLTGICLGDWGRDLKEDMRLPDLIEEIERIDKDFRIRLSSIEPNMVTDELISAIAGSNKICRHLHIPLQSGSDKILRLMNRPYISKEYMKIIKKARRAIPKIAITSDVMVGFPRESKRDFKETLNLIRRITPSRLHIFTYSARRETAANRYDYDLDPREVKRRRSILEDMAKISSYRYRRRFLRNRVEGLVETRRDSKTKFLTGYTDTYIKFLLDGPDSLMGKLIPLKITKLDLKTTFCKYL